MKQLNWHSKLAVLFVVFAMLFSTIAVTAFAASSDDADSAATVAPTLEYDKPWYTITYTAPQNGNRALLDVRVKADYIAYASITKADIKELISSVLEVAQKLAIDTILGGDTTVPELSAMNVTLANGSDTNGYLAKAESLLEKFLEQQFGAGTTLDNLDIDAKVELKEKIESVTSGGFDAILQAGIGQYVGENEITEELKEKIEETVDEILPEVIEKVYTVESVEEFEKLFANEIEEGTMSVPEIDTTGKTEEEIKEAFKAEVSVQVSAKVEETKEAVKETVNKNIEYVEENGAEIDVTAILKSFEAIRINGNDVLSLEGGLSIKTSALVALLKDLPTPYEMKSYTDAQFAELLQYTVELEFSFGAFAFDINVGLEPADDGEDKLDEVRWLMSFISSHVDVAILEDGTYSLELLIPDEFALLIKKAINKAVASDKIPDVLLEKAFLILSKDGEDLEAYLKDLDFETIVNILSIIDFNGLLTSDFVDKYVDLAGLTEEQIVNLIAKFERYCGIIKNLASYALDLVRNNGKDGIVDFIKGLDVDTIRDILADADYNGSITADILGDHTDLSGFSNEEILAIVSYFERYYDELKDLVLLGVDKIPDKFMDNTLFDIYQGNGVFYAKEDVTFNVENVLVTLLPARFEKYAPMIAALVDREEITIKAEVKVQFLNISSIEYKGDTTLKGFLPVGANLVVFGNSLTLNGTNVQKWVTSDNVNVTVMPNGDVVLYAAGYIAGAELVKTGSSATAYTLSVENLVYYVDANDTVTITYEWYKDGTYVGSGDTYVVDFASDNGNYKCVVTLEETDTNGKVVARNTVTVTADGIEVAKKPVDFDYNSGNANVYVNGDVVVNEGSYTYNTGSRYTYELPELDAKLEYVNVTLNGSTVATKGQVNNAVGTYVLTYDIALKQEYATNYTFETLSYNFKWTVTKYQVDFSAVKWESLTNNGAVKAVLSGFKNGDAALLAIEYDIFNEVGVEVTPDSEGYVSAPGVYTVYVSYELLDKANYEIVNAESLNDSCTFTVQTPVDPDGPTPDDPTPDDPTPDDPTPDDPTPDDPTPDDPTPDDPTPDDPTKPDTGIVDDGYVWTDSEGNVVVDIKGNDKFPYNYNPTISDKTTTYAKKDITKFLEKGKKGNLIAAYDITYPVAINGQYGMFQVKFKVPAGYEDKELVIFYIPEDGDPVMVESTIVDGYINFQTDHFSVYAIVEVEKASNWWIWVIVGVLAGAIVAVVIILIVRSKKNKEEDEKIVEKRTTPPVGDAAGNVPNERSADAGSPETTRRDAESTDDGRGTGVNFNEGAFTAPSNEEPLENSDEEPIAEEIPEKEITVENKAIEEKNPEETSIEEAPVEEAPVEEVTVKETAFVQEVPAEEALVEEALVEEALVEEAPVEEAPVEETPVEETPAEEAPVEEAPVEEAPVEEAPVEEAPVEEAPVEEAPAEEAPVEEAPVEEAPVEEAPVEEAPVEEAPVEEAPVEEAPVEEAPVEEAPVEEAPVEEAPVEEAPTEGTIAAVTTDSDESADSIVVDGEAVYVHYRSSFTSRLIQSDNNVKNYYNVIKNYLLSYNGVKSRTSWNYEIFTKGVAQCVKVNVKGKAITLNYALDPREYSASKYHFINLSDNPKFAQLPMLLKVRSERALKYALELIDEVMKKLGVEQGEVPSVDYSMPYESNASLAKRGIVKVILPPGVRFDRNMEIREAKVDDIIASDVSVGGREEVFLYDQEEDVSVPKVEEISEAEASNVADAPVETSAEVNVLPEQMGDGEAVEIEGNVVLIRYRSSFTSRLIQADSEVQGYYTTLKNYLLSYKGVKARTSWNYENFAKGHNQCARINLKGKTLTVNLALAPNSYNVNKYHFIDLSDNPKFDKLPMLLKIRSTRALKYALELIDELMKSLEIKQGIIPNVDYRKPFESNADLAKRGLMKIILPAGVKLDQSTILREENVDSLMDTHKQDNSNSEIPVEEAPVEEVSVEEAPVEEAPVEEVSAEETPVEEVTAEEAPVEEAPAEEAPAEEAPVEEVPAEETPAEEAPVEEVPAEEAPVEEAPAEEAPVEEAPVEEVSAEETPAEEAPAEEAPAEEAPVEEAPVFTDAQHADEILSDTVAEHSIKHIKKARNGKMVEVNIEDLCENFDDGDVVTLEALKAKHVISSKAGRIKILAKGKMTKSLVVEADKFSLQAVKMITLAGGTVKEFD